MGAGCTDSETPVIEADYREAIARGIPILAFFADEYAQIPPKFVERGEASRRVDAFRAEVVSKHAVALFNTPDELAKLVTAALARIEWPPKLLNENGMNPSDANKTNMVLDSSYAHAGAVAGAIAGSLLMPGIGGVIGGLLGSQIGKSISMPTPKKIYLSYRRGDGANVGRLYDALAKRYSPNNVFYDVNSIPTGVDWQNVISQWLASASVVLVIVGSEWLNAVDSDGKKRIDLQNDHVRLEISQALSYGKLIVPVLLHQAEMPTTAELPDDIRRFALLHAVHIRPDPDFHSDLAELMTQIDKFGNQH
jgi:hypothetical protein